jgi:hypothetical protein
MTATKARISRPNTVSGPRFFVDGFDVLMRSARDRDRGKLAQPDISVELALQTQVANDVGISIDLSERDVDCSA